MCNARYELLGCSTHDKMNLLMLCNMVRLQMAPLIHNSKHDNLSHMRNVCQRFNFPESRSIYINSSTHPHKIKSWRFTAAIRKNAYYAQDQKSELEFSI